MVKWNQVVIAVRKILTAAGFLESPKARIVGFKYNLLKNTKNTILSGTIPTFAEINNLKYFYSGTTSYWHIQAYRCTGTSQEQQEKHSKSFLPIIIFHHVHLPLK